MKIKNILIIMSIFLFISTILWSDNKDNVQTNEQYTKKIENLKQRLEAGRDNETKAKVLFEVLELKFINNSDAEKEIRELDDLLRKNPYGELHARADYLIGNILKINGAGNYSIERYYRAFKYYNKVNNSKEKARLALAIGENLRAFGEQPKALIYLELAKSLIDNKDERLKAEIYDRFAAVYFENWFRPEYNQSSKKKAIQDSCRYYGLKSLEYSIRNNDYPLIISSNTILGALEMIKYNYQRALVYLNQAKAAADKSNRLADKALVLSNIARLYEKQNMNDIALKTATEAFHLAKETNIKVYIMMSSQIMYEIYRTTGKYKKALEIQEEHLKAKDLIYEEQKTRYINLTSMKLDLDIKNKENELLKKEKELQKIKIIRQNQRFFILLTSVFFIILLTFIMSYFYYKTKRLNKRIQEEHQKVLELEKIKSVYAMAITANHELNQPLMVLKGNIEMLEMSISEMTPKQMNYISRINDSFEKMILLLQKYRENNTMHFESYADEDTMVVFDEDEDN